MNESKPDRIYHYFMDEEGDLYHDGGLLDEPEIYSFFLKHLKKNEGEESERFPYVAVCAGEKNRLACRDVPYVVQRLEYEKGAGEKVVAVRLVFQGDYEEQLVPETLFTNKTNILYCHVRKGEFLARFSRKAYYELAKLIVEKNGDYYLRLAKGDYLIRKMST